MVNSLQNVLVVGSMARAQVYQDHVLAEKNSNADQVVRAEMLDRLLEGGECPL